MIKTRPSLDEMIRPNFKRMQFYKSARGEFTGTADFLLDANENPYNTKHNRYPDPMQRPLRRALSASYGIAPESIFIGLGSSEAIDLLMRLVCRPGKDRIVQLPPTFGLYQVDADLNDLEVLNIPLDDDMQPVVSEVLAKAEAGKDRILFLCTPNNPVGNDYKQESVMKLVEEFPGIVVIDQAYIEFSDVPSYRDLIKTNPHVVVMETMSKAYGLAGNRVGVAFGDPELISWLNNIKPPYNVPVESAEAALQAISERDTRVADQIKVMRSERDRLLAAFAKTNYWTRVYPTNSNFILVSHPDCNALYTHLCDRGVILRNQTGKFGSGHLRISVGQPHENDALLEGLDAFFA